MTRKLLTNLIVTYLVLIVLMTSLITLVYCIPKESIRENVAKSCAVLADEGLFRFVLPGSNLTQLDSFTDALMYNMAWSGDSDQPYRSAMVSPTCYWENEVFVKTFSQGDIEVIAEMPKYWHGYLVIFKPLAVLFDYSTLRVINSVCFALVFLLCFGLLYRHVSRFAAWTFLGLYVALAFYVVPLNMQYSNAFYLAMGSMIAVILCRKFTGTLPGYAVMFFVFGGVTAYIDYFTIPVFIMGMPVLVYMLLHRPQRVYTTFCLLIAFWGLGYCSIWATKWVICTLTTDVNAFESAFSSALQRLSDFSDTPQEAYSGMSMQNLVYILVVYNRFIMLCCTVMVVLVLYAVTCRKPGFIKQNGWLIIMAALPLLYYTGMNNHFVIHYWFSWRSIFITLWASLLLLHAYRSTPVPTRP